MTKRKVAFDAAKTNNQTPTESMPHMNTVEEFTDRDATRAQERARIADREELEGKK
ncbi:hypothetical protein [Bacillus solimangrovi]|uniref:hypothetical protein n=1 Tax=Bacillus solimangrovi TaxID=1305675 RepID=UPI000A585FB7|nr:hypothetical protein [Bacillus solimangrovi]